MSGLKEQLLPCPFCGCDPELLLDEDNCPLAACETCGFEMPAYRPGFEHMAIAAWNRRTPASPAVQPVGDIESLDRYKPVVLLDGTLPTMAKDKAGTWLNLHHIRAALASSRVRVAPVLMAYVATDLDGHAGVGFTIEEAKRRAGEGCDTIIALHDISINFVELEGKPTNKPILALPPAAPALHAAAGADAKDAAAWEFIEELSKNDARDEILFVTAEGEQFVMYHGQDCCEAVSVESITGDLQDLIGAPILKAEEAVSGEWPAGVPEPECKKSATWTLYKLATINGYVDIRWLGESNGYYSESVDFAQIPAGQ